MVVENISIDQDVLAEFVAADRRRVAYFYDDAIVSFYYGKGHPMKPRRIGMTHELIMAYGLYRHMAIYKPSRALFAQTARFHSTGYLDVLSSLTPATRELYEPHLSQFGLGGDCPPFDGVADFSAVCTGGTLGCVNIINEKSADVAINWSGGLHHAKKVEASGFCYVNDIVIGILELLKYYRRVLYVDIDCHHGDGVEEAFYTTDRVLTVSLHQYGDFFPFTGSLNDCGAEGGTNFAINVPFAPGIDDDSYERVFKPIVGEVVQRYRPEVVVLQCGADSLGGDRLGCLNLTTVGHGKCVQFVRSLNLPLVLLGGGGYTIRNVARCWANETGIALGMTLANEIPDNLYYDHYAPNHLLHVEPTKMYNCNSSAFLQRVTWTVLQNIKKIPIAPSVQLQERRDSVFKEAEESVKEDLELKHSDRRLPDHITDLLVEHPAEHYSGDADNDAEAIPASLSPDVKRTKLEGQ